MFFNPVVLAAVFLVLITVEADVFKTDFREDSFKSNVKRQVNDENWYWGYADVIKTNVFNHYWSRSFAPFFRLRVPQSRCLDSRGFPIPCCHRQRNGNIPGNLKTSGLSKIIGNSVTNNKSSITGNNVIINVTINQNSTINDDVITNDNNAISDVTVNKNNTTNYITVNKNNTINDVTVNKNSTNNDVSGIKNSTINDDVNSNDNNTINDATISNNSTIFDIRINVNNISNDNVINKDILINEDSNTNGNNTIKLPGSQSRNQNSPEPEAELLEEVQQTTVSPTPQTKETLEENPCDRKASEMPDFKKPGRRISEQKCYEYIWQVKSREEKRVNEEACKKYNKLHGIVTFGIAAIGGRDALPGEFPHMGAIGWKAAEGTWVFKCGSTLISSKFAMTAAHCAKASPRDTSIADIDPKIIRFGDKNIIDDYDNGLYPTDSYIEKIIVHPEYKAPKKYYDIALVELSYGLEFNYNVQPACLWGNFDTKALGTKATLTGWGVVESAGRTTSPVLQVAEVDLVDSATCDSLLRPKCNRLWCGIQDTQICAGKLSGGVDACQGDSGGPLQVKINLPPNSEGAMHYVIGVTSFGFGCALENTPGVYTRVSTFINWIESIVWIDEAALK